VPLTALLLPGMDGTGTLFEPLARALAPDVIPAIASYPRDRCLEYRKLRSLVALPDGPFAIVAESFSGPLAIRIAAERPAHLRALVLVATFARFPWTDALRPLRPLLGAYLFRAPRFARMLGIRAALVGLDAPADLVRRVDAAIDRVVGPWALRHLRRCRPDARLVEIDGPHLVLQREPGPSARAIKDFLSEIEAA
jgi:pimeloyl-ACP methyl ester carboxylesterase